MVCTETAVEERQEQQHQLSSTRMQSLHMAEEILVLAARDARVKLASVPKQKTCFQVSLKVATVFLFFLRNGARGYRVAVGAAIRMVTEASCNVQAHANISILRIWRELRTYLRAHGATQKQSNSSP